MELVIFDFDGTIAELDIPWDQAKAEAIALAKAFGIDVDPSLHMMDISNILSGYPDVKGPLYQAFLRYETRCLEAKGCVIYPGMRELILDLKAKGYRLAVASANCVPTLEAALSRMGIRDPFGMVMGRESAQRNKPSPDQLDAIMEGLGIPREETLFVGNMVYDRQAAEAAGVSYFDITGHGKRIDELRAMLL